MRENLFEKYGGYTTFKQIVGSFCQKVFDSDNLSGYFENVNCEKIVAHQTNFISKLLDGPELYEGRSMEEIHKNLKIKAEDFVEAVELLEDALEEAEVEDKDIAIILQAIRDLQPQIVFT